MISLKNKAFVLSFLLISSISLQSFKTAAITPSIDKSQLSKKPEKFKDDIYSFYFHKEFKMRNGCWAVVDYVIQIAFTDNGQATVTGEITNASQNCPPSGEPVFTRITIGATQTPTVNSIAFISANSAFSDAINANERYLINEINSAIASIVR